MRIHLSEIYQIRKHDAAVGSGIVNKFYMWQPCALQVHDEVITLRTAPAAYIMDP